MTKRELDLLIDERVTELSNEVRAKYREAIQYEEEMIKDDVAGIHEAIRNLVKDSGYTCNPYSLNHLINCSFGNTLSSKKMNEELNEIRKEANLLKKKLIIIGLKDKKVSTILTQYLGLDK